MISGSRKLFQLEMNANTPTVAMIGRLSGRVTNQ